MIKTDNPRNIKQIMMIIHTLVLIIGSEASNKKAKRRITLIDRRLLMESQGLVPNSRIASIGPPTRKGPSRLNRYGDYFDPTNSRNLGLLARLVNAGSDAMYVGEKVLCLRTSRNELTARSVLPTAEKRLAVR